jgi:perosamine synthetase
MIPVSRPLIISEDLKAVAHSLENTYISGDTPPIKQMETLLSEKVGTRYAAAVSSGTSALDLAVESLNLKPGERVIVPAFTIVSTVTQLLRKGLEVHLVDADPSTWCMDVSSSTELINEDFRLIVPVHIYGLPVDMDPITKSARMFGLQVLEDSAEALGLEYKGKPAGSLGDLSTFSFYANKIVTGGEGGAICTNDSSIFEKVSSLRNLCFNPTTRYVHEDLGWNSRMSGLQATLIHSQLGRLKTLVGTKKNQGSRYLEGLEGHPWLKFQPSATKYSENVYWVFGVLLSEHCPYSAAELQEVLRVHLVESRRFFCPINLQPFVKNFPIFQHDNLQVAERLWDRGLYLPCGLGIKDSEIDYVIELLWKLSND